MALDAYEQDLFGQLYRKLVDPREIAELRRLEAYYDGVHRLEKLGIAVPPELEFFVTIVNWPRIATDSIEERLDVTGFRTGANKPTKRKPVEPPKPEVDPATGIVTRKAPEVPEEDSDSKAETENADELWRIWQANDLDAEAPLGHLDALMRKRAFIIVGEDEEDEDTPLITVESADDVAILDDERRPRIPKAALKMWSSKPGVSFRDRATLYVRGESEGRSAVTIDLEKRQDGKWVDVNRVEHDFGLVPVTRMGNAIRLGKREGRGEIEDIIGLTDAAARMLTNLQVGQETHALPTRVLIGAKASDFQDAKTGKQLTAWETYFGAVNALEDKDSKIAQFSASDLRNFHETGMYYARQVAALTGLPPHYLGIGAEQPPSAEAIKSVEARLVKRCERKQAQFGAAWERTMHIVRLMTGQVKVDDPRRGMLEVLWRDAGTPTQAQVDDGAVKKKQAGILSVEGAMEMTGMSQVQIARELDRLAREQAQTAALDPIAGLGQQIRSSQGGVAKDTTQNGIQGANPATSPAAQGRSSTTSATKPS